METTQTKDGMISLLGGTGFAYRYSVRTTQSQSWHGSCLESGMKPKGTCGADGMAGWHGSCLSSGMKRRTQFGTANSEAGTGVAYKLTMRQTENWHGSCLELSMKPKPTENMKQAKQTKGKDLKELAWESYGREACESEMELRYLIEAEPDNYWETIVQAVEQFNQREGRHE